MEAILGGETLLDSYRLAKSKVSSWPKGGYSCSVEVAYQIVGICVFCGVQKRQGK